MLSRFERTYPDLIGSLRRLFSRRLEFEIEIADQVVDIAVAFRPNRALLGRGARSLFLDHTWSFLRFNSLLNQCVVKLFILKRCILILILFLLLILIVVLLAHPGLSCLVEEDILTELEKVVKLWFLQLLL